MGFTDWDYGSFDRGGRRRRRRGETAQPEPILTLTTTIDRAAATDQTFVAAAQERLHERALVQLDRTGYTALRLTWTTDPPYDALGTVLMRLEVTMTPRLDGEWPAIHAAIAEDEADRAEAQAGKTAAERRLDALGAAAPFWRAKTQAEVREALSGRFPRSLG